jgi:hypothetical protein
MAERDPWKARTRRELIIEVWEKLDCESVGTLELEKISAEVKKRFGEGAVDSPAAMARILADEGAELRHHEVLEQDFRWRANNIYDALFRNVLKFSTLEEAAGSIRKLDNLRRQFEKKNDRIGLNLVRQTALKGKKRAQMMENSSRISERKRFEKGEIAQWFSIWLNSPELFEEWLELRQKSAEFKERFG